MQKKIEMLSKLYKIVNSQKDAVAYKVNNEEISYYELLNCSEKLAESLTAQGTDPVIIYGHKSIDMAISIIACLIANRAYVPVDIFMPIDRVKKIVHATNSNLIIKNENIDFDEVETLTIEEINEKYNTLEKIDTSENNIAYIIFTSGSTGEPKGVPISYKNLNNFVNWISNIDVLKLYKNINVLNQASFSFDLSVADFYYSLFNGHTLISIEKKTQENYEAIFQIIKEENINLMVLTPTFIKMLLVNKEFNFTNYPSLKCIYCCGEQLEPSIVKKIKERFNNIVVLNAYGPTEATSAVSAIVIDDEMLNSEYLPVGKLETAATDIEIVSDEIVLKGPSVFNGYLGSHIGGYYKDRNIDCYKTGDLGYIDNGLLYCKGRIDNQIKYKGYRIELGDIENNLLKIDGIREAVVIAKELENTNIIKLLKAYITVEKEISIENIKDKMKALLPEYMIPKSIVVLEKIPVNTNGKYDRKRLKDL